MITKVYALKHPRYGLLGFNTEVESTGVLSVRVHSYIDPGVDNVWTTTSKMLADAVANLKEGDLIRPNNAFAGEVEVVVLTEGVE